MIRRGLVIYEPKGRAGEYAPLACNLYRGCGHGCIYCYAPESTFIDRQEFLKASPRPGIINRLKKDAPIADASYRGEDRRVLLCFTCDPYQPIDEIYQLASQAIVILKAYSFNVAILTKAGTRAQECFPLLSSGDEFASTLTFVDERKSRQWEPFAALPQDRFDALQKAHDMGIKTWVSLEPVIEPAETLDIIRITHDFVDLYKVGKLNYHPKSNQIDWRKFSRDCIALLQELGCQYYIKKDLRGYL